MSGDPRCRRLRGLFASGSVSRGLREYRDESVCISLACYSACVQSLDSRTELEIPVVRQENDVPGDSLVPTPQSGVEH